MLSVQLVARAQDVVTPLTSLLHGAPAFHIALLRSEMGHRGLCPPVDDAVTSSSSRKEHPAVGWMSDVRGF